MSKKPKGKKQSCKEWEEEISEFEGVWVRFKEANTKGKTRYIRSDCIVLGFYEYKKRRGDKTTVAAWKARRFQGKFFGSKSKELDADIFLSDKTKDVAPGQTQLYTVRLKYSKSKDN